MYSFKKITHKLRKAINPSQTISTFQLSKSKQTTHCYFFKILKWQNVGTFCTLFGTCVLLNTQRFHEKSYFGNEINIEIDKTSD